MSPRLILISLALATAAHADDPLRLTRADYAERAHAAWVAQMAAVFIGFPFEHETRSVEWVANYPKPYTHAILDDDWSYEMSALRAFEKHGPALTIQQLGEQWRVDVCGTWGLSKEARLLMAKGVPPPDCGHPRHNRSWWTIGPQFSAEIYGLLAPGRPNLAGKLAREFGHINGYAEGVDGAVFVAGAVSLAFIERDPRTIVREAAKLIHAGSPYRRCLGEIIALADAGKTFEEIERSVIEHWAAEYPGTNNAVANGGIIAMCFWFGEGDFLKTVNLACRVSDYTDADCNAAGAAAVVGAMRGLKAIPANLLEPLRDRIVGDKMGDLALPPVDESISALGSRTAAMGEMMLLTHAGTRLEGETLVIPRSAVNTQPLERFSLADLTQYWAPGWTLERAGFGNTIGGKSGYGGTWLAGGVLTTWPRSEMRGTVLTRVSTITGSAPRLALEVAADPGRAWELCVKVGNTEVVKRPVVGAPEKIQWETLEVDLTAWAGKEATIRLYQNLLPLSRLRPQSVAHWKQVIIHEAPR